MTSRAIVAACDAVLAELEKAMRPAGPWCVQLQDTGTGAMQAWSFVRCATEAEARECARHMGAAYPEWLAPVVYFESSGPMPEAPPVEEVEVLDDTPWWAPWEDLGVAG